VCGAASIPGKSSSHTHTLGDPPLPALRDLSSSITLRCTGPFFVSSFIYRGEQTAAAAAAHKKAFTQFLFFAYTPTKAKKNGTKTSLPTTNPFLFFRKQTSRKQTMSSDDDFAMIESDYDNDDSIMLDDEENQPSSTSKTTATAKKVSTTTTTAATSKPPVLHTATNNDDTKKKKTVEEIYQKKSQLEHILLRPDTYSK
jgi:hypothetical protein